ncbi:MAG: hypothetical protein ACRD9S_11310 [Pyrinomonadaceae bacterium]
MTVVLTGGAGGMLVARRARRSSSSFACRSTRSICSRCWRSRVSRSSLSLRARSSCSFRLRSFSSSTLRRSSASRSSSSCAIRSFSFCSRSSSAREAASFAWSSALNAEELTVPAIESNDAPKFCEVSPVLDAGEYKVSSGTGAVCRPGPMVTAPAATACLISLINASTDGVRAAISFSNA